MAAMDPELKKNKAAHKEQAEEFNKTGKSRRETNLRWSLDSAAFEFGIARATMLKRARAAGIEPQADGCYSTQQVAAVVYGDYQTERARKMREDADAAEMKNALTRGEIVKKESVFDFCANMAVLFRGRIMAANIPREDKEKILAELKDLTDNGTIAKLCEPERD